MYVAVQFKDKHNYSYLTLKKPVSHSVGQHSIMEYSKGSMFLPSRSSQHNIVNHLHRTFTICQVPF